MTALAASAGTINASLRLDEVLQRILNETIQALQVETVALALVDPTGKLVFHAAHGKNAAGISGKQIPAEKGVVGWVVREKQGVVIPAVHEDQRFLPEVDQLANLDIRALACAPIHVQDRVLGVLEAINPISGTFDPDSLLVLAGIGNLAGSTIQHAQLFERLQAAHKRYRELFDDSIDPLILTDWNGKIQEANRQAAVLSGNPSKQLHDMNIASLYQVDWDGRDIDERQLKIGKTVTFESHLKSNVGKQIPIQVYVRRVVFEDVELLQWTLRDISERKGLDALREDMTAMIYHDLRSPLANIVSSMDVLTSLLEGDKDETIQSVITIATRSADRIQRLTSSLLDINRLESGQTIVSQQAASPTDLIREAVEAVIPMTESRHQSLVIASLTNLPSIWVDVDMIRRVLINLLENASKFTPPEGGLQIGAQVDGDWVRMWVQDNGPGISFADQERIFYKYTRLNGENMPGGLGVGLAFCRLAVTGHGGNIQVESKTGRGAKFILSLPVAKSE